MLPVTRRNKIHVPHSLAMFAAIVALIIALGWQSSEGGVTGVRAASISETRIEAAKAQAPPDKTERSVRAGASECEPSCDRDSLSTLLPLVLPSLSRP